MGGDGGEVLGKERERGGDGKWEGIPMNVQHTCGKSIGDLSFSVSGSGYVATMCNVRLLLPSSRRDAYNTGDGFRRGKARRAFITLLQNLVIGILC